MIIKHSRLTLIEFTLFELNAIRRGIISQKPDDYPEVVEEVHADIVSENLHLN